MQFAKTLAGPCLLVAMLLVVPKIAAANVFTENPDTGPLLHDAAVVPEGTTKIIGALTRDDVDLYRLTFPLRSVISFSVIPTGEWFDDDMTLFNGNGNPIAVADFAFSHELDAGSYYFALSDWNVSAMGAGGTIADDYAGILKTDGVLSGWSINTTPFRFGPYEINIGVDPIVPEPSGIILLATVVLAASQLRRRKI